MERYHSRRFLSTNHTPIMGRKNLALSVPAERLVGRNIIKKEVHVPAGTFGAL